MCWPCASSALGWAGGARTTRASRTGPRWTWSRTWCAHGGIVPLLLACIWFLLSHSLQHDRAADQAAGVLLPHDQANDGSQQRPCGLNRVWSWCVQHGVSTECESRMSLLHATDKNTIRANDMGWGCCLHTGPAGRRRHGWRASLIHAVWCHRACRLWRLNDVWPLRCVCQAQVGISLSLITYVCGSVHTCLACARSACLLAHISAQPTFCTVFIQCATWPHVLDPTCLACTAVV